MAVAWVTTSPFVRGGGGGGGARVARAGGGATARRDPRGWPEDRRLGARAVPATPVSPHAPRTTKRGAVVAAASENSAKSTERATRGIYILLTKQIFGGKKLLAMAGGDWRGLRPAPAEWGGSGNASPSYPAKTTCQAKGGEGQWGARTWVWFGTEYSAYTARWSEGVTPSWWARAIPPLRTVRGRRDAVTGLLGACPDGVSPSKKGAHSGKKRRGTRPEVDHLDTLGVDAVAHEDPVQRRPQSDTRKRPVRY